METFLGHPEPSPETHGAGWGTGNHCSWRTRCAGAHIFLVLLYCRPLPIPTLATVLSRDCPPELPGRSSRTLPWSVSMPCPIFSSSQSVGSRCSASCIFSLKAASPRRLGSVNNDCRLCLPQQLWTQSQQPLPNPGLAHNARTNRKAGRLGVSLAKVVTVWRPRLPLPRNASLPPLVRM